MASRACLSPAYPRSLDSMRDLALWRTVAANLSVDSLGLATPVVPPCWTGCPSIVIRASWDVVFERRKRNSFFVRNASCMTSCPNIKITVYLTLSNSTGNLTLPSTILRTPYFASGCQALNLPSPIRSPRTLQKPQRPKRTKERDLCSCPKACIASAVL